MKYFTVAFAMVIGITALWMSQKLIRLYFTVGGWHKTQAKVLSKEVIFDAQSTSQGYPYLVKVEYSYRYNNMDYLGNTVNLVELSGGTNTYRKAGSERRLSKIQNEASIFVNPENPSQSVMYRDGVILYFFIFIMGFFSIIIGLSKLF